MRVRQFAADHGWPHWTRVLMAMPGTYSMARRIWGWPRSSSLLEAVGMPLSDPWRDVFLSAARILAGEHRRCPNCGHAEKS